MSELTDHEAIEILRNMSGSPEVQGVATPFIDTPPPAIDQITRVVPIDQPLPVSEPVKPSRPQPHATPQAIYKEVAKLQKKQIRDRALKTKDGALRGCLENALNLLRFHPDFADGLAFNEFSLYAIAKKKTPWGKPAGQNWSDYDDSKTLAWFERQECFLGSSKKASEAVETVARENSFHPVKDYLKATAWDRKPRLNGWLITYAGADDTPLNCAMGERWLISSVARIFQPGCQVDSYLQLEGPQGIRKSTLLRTLAGDEYFTDHVSELGSKDSRIELHGKTIIEYPELDRIKGRDLNRVKAFLTARYDCFRPPYGRRAINVPRSCVFAATTNDATSLTDETGGRRCWPVRCGTIDIPQLERDRDQLWAEAYFRYTQGAKWYLDTKALNDAAREQQEMRYDCGVWDEVILAWLADPKQRYSTDGGSQLPIEPFETNHGRTTITDVLIHAVGKPIERCTQGDKNSVARCLVHDGWERKQDRSRGPDRGKWFYVRGSE